MKTYTPVWNKYRPAIVRMMVDSLNAPQSYKLYAHEFKAMNDKQKGGYNFVLQVSKGKAINNIRDCVIAQELLEILQLSRKASELIDESPYEITLDKQFVLRVSKMTETVPQ
jgi:hypothetical protein